MEVFFIDDIDKLLGEGFSLQIRIEKIVDGVYSNPTVYAKKCPSYIIVNFLQCIKDFLITNYYVEQSKETNTFRFELSKDDYGDLKINQPK